MSAVRSIVAALDQLARATPRRRLHRPRRSWHHRRIGHADARREGSSDRDLRRGVRRRGSAADRRSRVQLHPIDDRDAHVAARVDPAALLVVVPYYTRPSETAIVEHFRAIATASSAPLVVYNVPYRTGRGRADAILELAAMPEVVGIKQTVGALDDDTLQSCAAGRPDSPCWPATTPTSRPRS